MATHPPDPEPLTSADAGDERTISIFLAAMSQPLADRAEFVAQACAGDDELQARVARRVEWEERMRGFLLKPVASRERWDQPFAAGDLLLNRFRIVRVAGEGGMGIVYEAQDEKLGHRIALKCPRYEFRKRLSPEALQSLRVTHPNVCRVFEIHTTETPLGDVDFLTMEFLVGETMSARLESAPARWLESAEGAEIARQICAGLAAVHAQGIIHRDLKPSNVMLAAAPSGAARAVIMDFGLAQGLDLFSSQMRGTPAYFAPELWMGQPASVRSDLYALAVLLFQMATGHQPFPADTPWNQRLRQVPAAAELRGAFRPALLRCLDPDPARRYSHVEELRDALWPGVSRRTLAIGGVALAATAAAGVLVRNRVWPTSPVRLAIIPPAIDLPEADAALLLRGFSHDLAHQLRTLRGARRPLTVVADVPVTSAASTLGATHTLALRLGATRLFSARLTNSLNGQLLAAWENPIGVSLGAQLFALQSTLMSNLIAALQLASDPSRVTGLDSGSYPVYLKALRIAREDYEHAASAIPLFEETIRLSPNAAVAHAGLAEALVNARFAERKPELETPARLALEKAEQLDPNLPQVHTIIGRLEMIAGHYERSRTSYRRAAEMTPYEPQIYISMAYPAYMTNRFDEAETALNTAIALNPSYYKPYVDAGYLADQRRRFGLAEQHWRTAIRLAPPSHIGSRLDLAGLLVTTGRLAEAESLLDELDKIRATPQAVQLRGDLRVREGKVPEALALYEKVTTLPSPDYRLWSSLGTCYAQMGRTHEAQMAFRRGIAATEAKLASNRRQPDALSWLALYHAKLGAAPQVDTLAAEAHTLAGYHQWTVCKLLVLAYGVLGQTHQALALLKDAPPDLLRELARCPDLVPELRRQPVFQL